MFEYHGWIALRSTAEAVDDEPPLRLGEIQALVDELAGYALMDLQAMNGTYYVHVGGNPNRRGVHGAAVIDLFTQVGRLAPGSYGLLYVHDEVDADFRVFRLVRGVVTEHADSFLSPVIPTLEDRDLPVLTVDGTRFADFDGFAREFSGLLHDYTWRGNLDAFNDILGGGFGTPGNGWILRWLNSELSRSALGYEATVQMRQRILRTCHPSNRPAVQAAVDRAKRGEGPTLFDEIVEIIRDHESGSGGIRLELR